MRLKNYRYNILLKNMIVSCNLHALIKHAKKIEFIVSIFFEMDIMFLIQKINMIQINLLNFEDLIQRLCLEIGNIKKILIQLNQGLRIKYQLQKERIFKLDAKQLNQTFDEMFKCNEITQILIDDIKYCSNDMIIQLKYKLQN
ncbi:unnamed protein product [Paramecium primaurelia]|uniref:Uncharacterized protein n=1 Tax=Paramecium primaurelia TaxID=5886 RepID=A0A8S1PKS7_PARPR|nr:unnamed protein product [Paramecium primaurelia]